MAIALIVAPVNIEKDRQLEVHYADADGILVSSTEAVEEFVNRTMDIHFSYRPFGCNVRSRPLPVYTLFTLLHAVGGRRHLRCTA